jgi:hypothetical protein
LELLATYLAFSSVNQYLDMLEWLMQCRPSRYLVS